MVATAALRANQAEFEFEAGPHAAGELAVVEFQAEEGLSRLYSVELVLAAAAHVGMEEKALIGQSALLKVHLGGGETRFFHGMISRIARWDAGGGPERQRYRITVVPRLWALRHTLRSRIFQELSVPQIVTQVLTEGGVEHRAELKSSYRKREYCVQYHESDFNFVSRLLEEEGIFYSFEHSEGTHVLVLNDASITCQAMPGDSRLVFRDPARMVAGSESVHELAACLEVYPGAVVLRDYNFVQPRMDLTSSSTADEGEQALEIYDYPARYEDPGTGRTLAKIRLEELRANVEQMTGASNCRRLLSGTTFSVDEHPLLAFNQNYLLLWVRHTGRQPEVLTVEQSASGVKEGYRNEFRCMPAQVPYRPPRDTPCPIIPGAQTAMVVGPGGEEVHTDPHGRIKVQFHWDREGQNNERSSCWIRVSQAWAGQSWGALYLPRMGHEVVVEFLEGDPDRPLVTGSVYNGQNPPPIALPDDKTRSTLRSSSSLGGSGSNELRIEDKAGREEVYLHAQKDFNIVVENDKTQQVRGNEKLLVKKDRSRTIEGNQSLEVKKNDDTLVGGNQSLEVAQNRSTTVKGNHTEDVAGNQSIQVGGNENLQVAMVSTETVGLGKMLTIGGAYAITVGAALNQLVGGLMSEQVGMSKMETVGASKSETVMGSRTMTVGGELSEQVGMNRSLQVGKDLQVSVGGNLGHTVKEQYKLSAKEITVEAEEEFLLKVGAATLQVKKSGDVILKGTKVQIKGDEEVVVEGSKISEN
ncbi:type VI secretion system Vgr family protein [Hyalangium versicolor]|uniref:type VI secretion system Vgr family protein n=1 Tax=Hyalangium versicolor TaxID=2861190 RepID=UPI001CC95663|nr:type VI secretion system tip protein VgrG [Hyalangium versicolor]